VIVISGHASVSDAVQAMKTGAIEFLEKPYVISTLRESVTKALQIRRVASQEDGARSTATSLLRALEPQELSVAESTATGDTDKLIAARLDVSTRTVQLRRASAIKKLQVSTKADLIRLVHSASAAERMRNSRIVQRS
jgi:two-component system response regulator FixJ